MADSKRIQCIALAVLLGLITLSFFHSPGTGDVKYWLKWIETFDAQGPFRGFESTQWDYPPFSSIALYGTAKMGRLLSIDNFTALKLSLTLYLFLTSLIFWAWTRDLILTAVVHFSLLLNSVMQVYIDLYFAPWFLLSLLALKERKLTAFTVLYSISCLIKWQPIVIAPFLLLHVLNIRNMADVSEVPYRRLLVSVGVPFGLILLVTALLYTTYFLKSFLSGVTSAYLSGTALNFSWVMTYFLHLFYPGIFGPLNEGQAGFLITGSIKVLAIPKALFFIFYAGTLLSYFRKEKNFEHLVHYALLGFLAYYIFNTGVHENHLFVPMILAGILYFLNREHIMTVFFVIVMSNLNPVLFYGTDGLGLGFSRVVGVDSTLLISIFNVLFFLLIWTSACLQGKKAGKA